MLWHYSSSTLYLLEKSHHRHCSSPSVFRPIIPTPEETGSNYYSSRLCQCSLPRHEFKIDHIIDIHSLSNVFMSLNSNPNNCSHHCSAVIIINVSLFVPMQSGDIIIVNHRSKDTCHLKFSPYSYFSRDVPRKVSPCINHLYSVRVFQHWKCKAVCYCPLQGIKCNHECLCFPSIGNRRCDRR